MSVPPKKALPICFLRRAKLSTARRDALNWTSRRDALPVTSSSDMAPILLRFDLAISPDEGASQSNT
jgi:hypothetical protein